jgi:predicted nucleotidyltransferase component of viral defense system
MKISREKLLSEAETTGFHEEVLEKVIQLLNLLAGFRSHPFLKGRLALKGGTALNLFMFNLPRLSVDIDLNYVRNGDREVMLAERPKIEEAVQAVCAREDFTVRRIPEEHAGGKWLLRYESAIGQDGNLEIDLNYMFRIPLWPVRTQDSQLVGSYKARGIAILDIHEIAAGKLAALLSRHEARDLFDVHQLLIRGDLNRGRLRLAFLVYGAMNRKDWRTVSVDDVAFDANELENHLIPLLRRESLANAEQSHILRSRLVEECRQALEVVLPLSKAELEFLDRILDHGEIDPSLLTTDEELAERIRYHPGLKWKAINVRQYRGK